MRNSRLIFLLILFAGTTSVAYGQFNNNLGPIPFGGQPTNNRWGTTSSGVTRVGIGQFPTNASIDACLHISQPFLAPGTTSPFVNDTIAAGETFRSTVRNTATQQFWRMYQNATTDINGAQIERARLFTDGSAFSVFAPSGVLRFGAATGGVYGTQMLLNTNGNLGLGLNFGTAGGNILPQNLLHLNLPGNNSVFQQFTNGTSTAGNTGGFRIGINGTGVGSITGLNSGDAVLYQRQNNPMVFFTNDLESMRITQAGTVGIGITAPAALLHLNGTMPLIVGNQI
jgi:hypothetical protein